MVSTLHDILGPDGAIARRLGKGYEHRPQQLEMADAVASAFAEGHNLLVEAGTGVGKSFAYLLPAIDYAVRTKKRVVISTHTISLQEQLMEKDIPLLQSVYPDEFTAVLVKGRSNYLCQRRLTQARTRQSYMFDDPKQLDSLWTIEDWAQASLENGGNGSLAELPAVPDAGVWDKVCAEAGNCLGKKCEFYKSCFWQAAKRRMGTGNVLIVNHALFFSDLALRMAGVNYLPKYDVAVLDEAHTIEDVAGQHFGLKISEAGVRYALRALYDTKRGRGTLSVHGASANESIRDIVDLGDRIDDFFDRCIRWHEEFGRGNGRLREPLPIEDHLTPKLRDLALHLKEMLPSTKNDEELSELTAAANKIVGFVDIIHSITTQSMADAVYWMEVAGRAPRRVSLHAAPVNVADGLRRYLFEKTRSVVMTSATLCTGGAVTKGTASKTTRGTGVPPVIRSEATDRQEVQKRQGGNLPHWTRENGVYAVTMHLADSLPQVALDALREEQESLDKAYLALSVNDPRRSKAKHALERTAVIDRYLDRGHGECLLRDERAAGVLISALTHFDEERYRLISWCVMPNHVHVVLQPIAGFQLSSIMHSIKSWSAKEVNRVFGRSGEVWQKESYDHLVRDEKDLRNQVEYAFRNAERAGWIDWQWRGTNEEYFAELVDGGLEIRHEQDAHATEETSSAVDSRFCLHQGPPRRHQRADPRARLAIRLQESGDAVPRDRPAGTERSEVHAGGLRGNRQVPQANQRRGVRAVYQLQDADRRGQPAEPYAGRTRLSADGAGPARAAEDSARSISDHAASGAVRDQQLLAGDRRAGECAAERDHRETAVCGAG